MLDVEGRDHVDAGVEQLLDVLPALLVPRRRARWCARARRRARPRAGGRGPRRRPSPRTSRRGSSIVRRGTTSRSPTCSAVFGRPWVSTKPTTTSVPRSRAAAALVEHREGLADAGRGAEVDAKRPARHAPQRAASEPGRRGRGSARARSRPARRGSRASVRRCARRRASSTCREREPACARDAGGLERASAREMCGSRPEPEDVTASTGTRRRREAVLASVRGDRGSRTSWSSVGFVGPRFEAELDIAS